MDRDRRRGVALMLLLDSARLNERRAAAAAGGPLAALADSLAADLEIVMERTLYVPREKALLSRAGGRCEDDAMQLEFDPYSPDEHRCPACGRVYIGEFHHRWWVYWYQLWLAERVVNAALLHLLRGDPRHGAYAREVALRYCAMYADYPNRDNVLGPTRLFFSTYLESIWLLQLCVTADLLESAGDRATADEIREKIARPSAALIAQYDEGMSNRQVWNNAAMMAAALLLGDRAKAERVVRADSGVETHLSQGILDDGTWYEGENYHLFAHRGLWYCVTLAETAGIAIDPKRKARFDEGFAAPFATALPDFTLPSRKDSQYAISLRQPRFAELCELGLARSTDKRLTGALAELYAGDVPRGDTNRARSTADVERNLPATSLTRADLGWRSLLHARTSLPPLERVAPKSAHLTGQGISVFRRERGQVYVALDWGQSGGGHGHPDRLNVLFMHGATRWLDDLGTGSYVDPSLHWYRSTLAHNAPLINGRSQARVNGTLLAYEERGEFGWIVAAAEDLAPGVTALRTLVVAGQYFIDELRWESLDRVQVDLPIHFDGELRDTVLSDGDPIGISQSPEDGFDFVSRARSAAIEKAEVIEMFSDRDEQRTRAFVSTLQSSRLFHASAPGQPHTQQRGFYLIRTDGRKGVIRSVWAWSAQVRSVEFSAKAIEIELQHERHVHREAQGGWRIDRRANAGRERVLLAGWVDLPPPPGIEELTEELSRELRIGWVPGNTIAAQRTFHSPRVWISAGSELPFEFGAEHYRRSEQTYEEAGSPTALVKLSIDTVEVAVAVEVEAKDIVFVANGEENPFDNEPPEINGHGVQLYVATMDGGGAWLVVPDELHDAARVRPIPGWGDLTIREATWKRTENGYSMRLRVTLPRVPKRVWKTGYIVAVDVIINETETGRERRRGQLVLSGGHGEFVYLRGDRQEPERLWRFNVVETGKKKK